MVKAAKTEKHGERYSVTQLPLQTAASIDKASDVTSLIESGANETKDDKCAGFNFGGISIVVSPKHCIFREGYVLAQKL